MARTTKQQHVGPDWPPEQALRVLRQQLDDLQKLRGRRHDEAHNDEEQWAQLTMAGLIHGFGPASHNIKHYYGARSAGQHNMYGISDHQRQINFQLRIDAYESTVKSSIAELEAGLPEAAVKGAYAAGDEFAFYKELKSIIAAATKDIFIVDNYLNTEFFELYVEPIRPGTPVRILTDKIKGTLQLVATKYAVRGSFELRTSPDVHDRHVFVDGRGWMIGQSIKDAAKKKPTYMVEIGVAMLPSFQKIYEDVWTGAASVVKSQAPTEGDSNAHVARRNRRSRCGRLGIRAEACREDNQPAGGRNTVHVCRAGILILKLEYECELLRRR
jgi:hypothetical protein